jgi:hypothetical protein
VRFETSRSCGRRIGVADAACSNASSTGSTSGEWKACETGSFWQRTPRAVKRSQTASTAAAAPEITVWVGALTAAIDSCAANGATASATSASAAKMAAIAPPAGSDCISRPRSAISASACGKLITPARQAAAYSPTEWPITTSGVMPQDAHSFASAISTLNSAGCV